MIKKMVQKKRKLTKAELSKLLKDNDMLDPPNTIKNSVNSVKILELMLM